MRDYYFYHYLPRFTRIVPESSPIGMVRLLLNHSADTMLKSPLPRNSDLLCRFSRQRTTFKKKAKLANEEGKVNSYL